MSATDTKQELLRHLDSITRTLDFNQLAPFTTAAIASDVNVSRNLASQYLNDLVREGFLVKINTRPVIFMHRKGVERHLQGRLDGSEFSSLEDLMLAAGIVRRRDFDSVIGRDLSLSACIEQLKSAIAYPPHGLPVILVGETGTGKAMLSRTMFDYGVNSGVLPSGARYIAVDCSRYAEDDTRFRHDLMGANGLAGFLDNAAGGIIYLSKFDRLSPTSRNLILERLYRSESDEKASKGARSVPARLVLSTSRHIDDPLTRDITHRVPVVVVVPELRNRTVEERTDLVMHFLHGEGRRVAADVAISRGALRSLVEANFEENVDGLRACVTNCCAGAFLNRKEERLVIRSYNLPASVLGVSAAEEDDDKLVEGDKRVSPGEASRVGQYFQAVLDAYISFSAGHTSFGEFFSSASESLKEFQDYLNFEDRSINPRIAAFEKVLAPIFERTNASYGIELSRKSCHALAQVLYIQLWGDTVISRWRTEHAETIRMMLQAIMRYSRTSTIIVDQLDSDISNALGVNLDALTQSLLLIDVKEVIEDAKHGRENVGIILAHGYSTATSIADAANRILHRRVFEAIDMAYDQQFSEIAGQLSRVLERYAYASTIAVLVDMGSLSEVDKTIHGIANGDLYVVNNVSTGLALEVGSALISGDHLGDVLDNCTELLTPKYHVIRGSHGYEAIVFCSENGADAAERIRRLVAASLPDELGVRLVTADYLDLLRKGKDAAIFGSYRVRAIIGTMDPGIEGVPFVGLDDILANGSPEALDRVLMRTLGPDGIARFHVELLKNVTLKSVVKSITILDPERLFDEAELALSRLQERMGQTIEQRKIIGIYVHLCGLIERLVTKNFVDTHPRVDVFAREQAEFIAWFRESFRDLAQRYRVEIPESEIAYVYDFIYGTQASNGAADPVEAETPMLVDE